MTVPYLYQEIVEQSEAVARLWQNEGASIRQAAAILRAADPRYLTIAARGASDNAGIYGKYLFASLNRLPVALATPSLYTLYHTPPRLAGTAILAISQSGEARDILAVVEEARRQGIPTIALTNVGDSPLARAADTVILQHAGQEKSIAATKTYITQLFALAWLSAELAEDAQRVAELATMADAVARTLAAEEAAREAAATLAPATICIVMGRGYTYGTAFEVALKLKELAYIAAEPFSSADFMHGPIALVEEGLPIIVVAPQGQVYEDLRTSARVIKEKGARIIAISDGQELLAEAHHSIPLPVSVPEWLSPLTAIVPGQLLTFHVTQKKGYDPDHPRGLKKVTYTF
jgi:glucosamine--fructose-6-phosphate aminotransferase (isomerizing)